MDGGYERDRETGREIELETERGRKKNSRKKHANKT